MCDFLGYNVTKLTRVKIMHIKLNSLPLGAWRYLTPAEIEKLNISLMDSVNTEETLNINNK